MLDRCFTRPDVIRRLRASPLGRDIERLAVYLLDRGHTATVIQVYLQAVEHFGRWLGRENIPPTAADAEVVARFLNKHLPNCRCSSPSLCHLVTVRAAMRHWAHLHQEMNPRPCGDVKLTPAETLVHEFDEHMQRVCGFQPETRLHYQRYARRFLQSVFGSGELQLSRLNAKQPMAFIRECARRWSPETAHLIATSLRGFFRFLQFRGLCDGRLAQSVPSVHDWGHTRIPKTLDEGQVRRFLDSFDRSTAVGQRDYAMALCMVDLGLRASDVVHLQLKDVDWRESVLRIATTKCRRGHVLPLPQRVGQALAKYLRCGRPCSGDPHLFLRHRPPRGVMVSRGVVRWAVKQGLNRCGIGRLSTGTHILRHTAATRMIQRGATMKEIADVLGHRSINTSAIYAKVNLPMLARVAMPWPEVQP